MKKCRYFNKCKHKTGWCNSETAMITCEFAVPMLKREIDHLNCLMRLIQVNCDLNCNKEDKNEP